VERLCSRFPPSAEKFAEITEMRTPTRPVERNSSDGFRCLRAVLGRQTPARRPTGPAPPTASRNCAASPNCDASPSCDASPICDAGRGAMPPCGFEGDGRRQDGRGQARQACGSSLLALPPCAAGIAGLVVAGVRGSKGVRPPNARTEPMFPNSRRRLREARRRRCHVCNESDGTHRA
jgi:hypothetical protein